MVRTTHVHASPSVPYIAGNFRGYKCSWFSLIKHVPRAFIPTNLIPHACMLAKGCYSVKINLQKPFWRYFREILYPRNIRYTVYVLYHLSLAHVYVESHSVHVHVPMTEFGSTPCSESMDTKLYVMVGRLVSTSMHCGQEWDSETLTCDEYISLYSLAAHWHTHRNTHTHWLHTHQTLTLTGCTPPHSTNWLHTHHTLTLTGSHSHSLATHSYSHTYTYQLDLTLFIEWDLVLTAGGVEGPVGWLEATTTDVVHLQKHLNEELTICTCRQVNM